VTAPVLHRVAAGGHLWVFVALMLSLSGCADPIHATAPSGEDDTTDVRLKTVDVPAAFSQNELMSDAFFVDVDWIDAPGLRAFFARVPGAGRSWLLGATLAGRDAADLIVETARAEGLNPAVLVVRMQVEASAVSPGTRPSESRLAALMGCGCADGERCDRRFAGVRNQLVCAAQTFRALYEDSLDGVGEWRRGRTTRTLDGYTVTPRSHATAAHYAYTPWVLPGQGGNWLAWRVARDYAEAMRGVRRPVAPTCATFADVGPEHPAYRSVEAGAAAGFWTGCGDDRFCPGDGLSRAAAAVVVDRVLRPRLVRPTGRFSDVHPDHWAAGAIESLAAAGLVSGCGEGRFCPDRRVTRAELAALLLRAGPYSTVSPNGLYVDVPPAHWAAGAIEALAPTGALGTCGDGRFCPDAATSRGQMAIAVARVFGLSPVDPCR
jgi:hypothetical protein